MIDHQQKNTIKNEKEVFFIKKKERERRVLLSDAISEKLFGFLAFPDELSRFNLFRPALRSHNLLGGASRAGANVT